MGNTFHWFHIWAHARQVRCWLPQVQRGQLLVTEEHLHHAVLAAGANGDALAGEGLADLVTHALVAEVAVVVDAAHRVAGAVLDWRQRLGERPWRRRIATGGRAHVQRLVRALPGVQGTPPG